MGRLDDITLEELYDLKDHLSTLEEYLQRGLSTINEPDSWPYLTSKDSS
jgi:hypothetical protein